MEADLNNCESHFDNIDRIALPPVHLLYQGMIRSSLIIKV